MTDDAYKLVERAEWDVARAAGAYDGSAVDLADGYIHLSGADQLAETARRHYVGRKDLILIAVDLRPLGDDLKWEASRGGALFPHLYSPLPVAVATWERPLSVDAEGVMRFDDGAIGWP